MHNQIDIVLLNIQSTMLIAPGIAWG